jgi:crotonobetainyl-CoA:carnitine CoA-transferase CaiB-like acyl-CoA transferase
VPPRPILHGVQVLDRTTGIAGPYCTKMLADAGADVVKVEPAGGDSLRAWRSGGLFEFLNASKRSAPGEVDAAPAGGADILVADEPLDVGAVWASSPGTVVVTITPFGTSGPWAGRPWTEFTLQAACGSTGQRGLPEHPPVAAGGRIGEWAAGAYAAVGALAAWREARRSGAGEHVDVAILDCMAVAMVTYPSLFSSFFGWPPMPRPARTVEVPSIEPASDGYVVVTTNSAQQFRDFLVLIERADLVDDHHLAQAMRRFARRDEFLAAVHAHTAKRSVEELLDEAALFRIPAAPVLDGSSVPGFEQFAARGVFSPSPSGRFVVPRIPYRISAPDAPASEAPPQGEGQVGRIGGASPHLGGEGPGADWALPLAGVRIVDCTAWWAGPSATHVLACLGADVIKVESTTRPDQMRLAGTKRPGDDRWWEWGPIHHGVNGDKRAITLDLTRPEGLAAFERLLGSADVLVENYTPRVMEQFGLGWEPLHERHPRLIMVRMPAFGLDGPWRDRTGFAQTMESLTGMAWLTGFADGPPVLVRGACDPVAGMHAAFATILALIARGESEPGSLVESAMVEAALNVAAEQVIEHSASGAVLTRDGNRGPAAAPQGVYPCSGTDEWVAVAVAEDEQWRSLCALLGRDAWAEGARAHAAGRRRHADNIDAAVSAWTSVRHAADAAETLVQAGIPAAEVVVPRDIVHNPQLRFRGLFETEDHPVTGSHEIPMLPFRYSRVDGWLRTAAATLGQHNDEVLGEIGLDGDAVQALRNDGVIGEQLAGA